MKFTTTIDKKYTVWQRIDIEFEADNLDHAKLLLEKWDGTPPDVEYINTETLYDTEEEMTKEENDNQPVYEIIYEIEPE